MSTVASRRRRLFRPRRAKNDRAGDLEAMAGVCHRLAVLLGAGVPPAAAWRYVAEGAASPNVRRVAQLCVEGQRPESALVQVSRQTRDESWAALAAAWSVATEAGSPLATTLRALASSCRGLAHTERDIQVALTGPRATARVVVALPFVGILFGLLMGFNVLRVLFATGPGIVCLVLGSALLWAGTRWNRALVSRARPREVAPGLMLDLLGVAMRGGVSADRAHDLVSAACQRARVRASGSDEVTASSVFDLSARAGVPAAELLHSEAVSRRRQQASTAQQKASRLAVSLMLPLGCCVLPSFLVLGVAPLLLALLSSTIATIA